MSDCEKNNIKCPPTYKNIGSESFGDNKKVTAELLYQFCQNDSYLYEQVKSLWDKTDPEHRKRFYAPYYMDTAKSYGIEPLVFSNEDDARISLQRVSADDRENKLKNLNGNIQDTYHLSNVEYEQYDVDFDYTNDEAHFDNGSNGQYNTLIINNDSIIEDSSTLRIVTENIGTDDLPVIKHTVLPTPTTNTLTGKIPYKTYSIENKVTDTTKTTKKKVVTKEDVYGKLTLDANCDGPYHNWHANSVWYIGYNRHKNYNVKNAWRKNPDNTTIPSVCRGQTFKAKHSGELRKVVLLMKGSSKSVSPCIVEIRTVKKGKPTTKVLARAEQKFNHSSKALVNFTFKKPCKVTKGTTYAIVVRSPLSNFNHCYWLGGWASTCFSNSKKRAYYDGETFLSEDNGKTWIVHGKKEKCYGSHYYDWGFAEAPVNFGFEVYIAPKTGTKSKTSYVPVTTGGQTVTQELIESTDYLTPSITMNYYEAGDYYLEFKPFVGNFYTSITCIYDVEQYNEGTNIGEYKWEIFNPNTNEDGTTIGWENFADTTLAVESHNNSSNKNFEVLFKQALTFVKVRLKLHLEDNVLDDVSEFLNGFEQTVNTLGETEGISGQDLVNWVGEIVDQFAWKSREETPLGIRKLNSLSFRLNKKPSFKGYLRTLEYHPVQDGMLPACIWSEVDVDAMQKNNGDCKIDIVHEKTAIEHMKLYKINNIELIPYILDFTGETNESAYVDSDDVESFILADYNDKKKFIDYLKKQNPKVYLLPYYDEENSKYIYFFGNKAIAPLELEHYPAYPINSCSIGTDDIQFNLHDSINNEITKKDSTHIEYTHTENLTGVKSINICYRYNDPNNEDETIVEFQQLTENDDYSVDGTKITFNVNSSSLLSTYLEIGANITLKSNPYINVDETELIVEMTGYDYNEFQNYIIDYDNKTMNFYNQLGLVEGELKVNYNPLWVRDLSPSDFPLKMDLWTEYFLTRQIGTDKNTGNPIFSFDKYPVNDCGKIQLNYGTENMPNKEYIETSVPPLDNIRSVTLENTDGLNLTTEALIEDEDYFVDYLTNRIYMNTPLSEETVIVVKYTPNLTDNGLSLAYRLSRPLYSDSSKSSIVDDTLIVDKNSFVDTDINNGDDVFCLSNYFTTRT